MTSLDDFRRVLNANPKYTDTLLILADWCDEHGEPYGEGYRALGVLRKYPHYFKASENWGWFNADDLFGGGIEIAPECQLPDRWFCAIEKSEHVCTEGSLLVNSPSNKDKPDDRRYGPFVLFKAAAKAFCSLPAERRAELLAGVPETSSS